MDAKPTVVLDTNVVLNWLFFQTPPTIAVIEALLRTHTWVSTQWMAHEAQRVAHCAHLAKYASPAAFERLSAGFAASARIVEASNISPLRCRDPDDQAFLNLAFDTQALLLLSLDKDLLKLRKRAATLRLVIKAP